MFCSSPNKTLREKNPKLLKPCLQGGTSLWAFPYQNAVYLQINLILNCRTAPFLQESWEAAKTNNSAPEGSKVLLQTTCRPVYADWGGRDK